MGRGVLRSITISVQFAQAYAYRSRDAMSGGVVTHESGVEVRRGVLSELR